MLTKKSDPGIGYDMIIGCDLILQIGTMVDFKCQVFQWYDAAVPMNDPIMLLGQIDLKSCEICKLVMYTT